MKTVKATMFLAVIFGFISSASATIYNYSEQEVTYTSLPYQKCIRTHTYSVNTDPYSVFNHQYTPWHCFPAAKTVR